MRLANIARHSIVTDMSRKAIFGGLALLLTAAGDTQPAPPACGVDLASARAAVSRVFEVSETRAVKLTVDDCPAITVYAPDYGPQNRFISWSMAKTITAMLVGELVADGKLQLDDPVPLAEWRGPGDPHAAITLRQMLNMQSGVRHSETADPVENSDTNQALFVSGSGAMAKAAFAQPVEVPPGSRWEYNTLTTVLLAELVTRTLTASADPRMRAQAYRAFAEERLFRPAGVTSAFLEFDGSGTQVGGSLIHMTLDDWSRMAALLVDGKGADGGQVVAPEWLAFMKTPAAHSPEYGGQLWLNHPVPGGEAALFPGKGPDSTVAMNGHLGQLVIAAAGPVNGAPHRLTLVRLGNTPDKNGAALMGRLGDVVEAVIPRAGTTPR
jgi:CubicO group peptidase (beta-lactamase class C family)